MKPLAVFIFALVLAGSARAADTPAPAINWVFPLFSKEGYRTLLARGSEAHITGEHQFAVTNLNLTFFSGDAATTIETIILSPAATFLPEAKIAHGEQSVRFIRDDVDATGTRWVYNHDEKKISLDGDVRVTFRAELKDILK